MNQPLVTRHASFLAAAVALATASASAASGFRATPIADYKEGALSFGIAGDLSVVGGTAKEHVFSPKRESAEYAAELGIPDDGRRHQLSRLDWDMSSALLGVAGSARYERFSLNAGFWYGGSGTDDYDMEDWDWQAGDQTRWTDYSRSDSELTDAWMFDVNLSYDAWRSDDFTGSLFVGARQQRWKWTCDGWTDTSYAEDGFVWNRFKGHGCDYRQVLSFGYVGASGTWRLADALDLTAYASWAPGWKGRDRDNHIAAEKDTHSSFDYDGNVYAAGLSLDWHVAANATVSFGFDWQKATLNEGALSQTEYDTGLTEVGEDVAGMENEYLAFTVGCAVVF